MKKFTITPVVTVKNGDKDVTDAYDITAVSANIAISQVPMVAAISKGKSITGQTFQSFLKSLYSA